LAYHSESQEKSHRRVNDEYGKIREDEEESRTNREKGRKRFALSALKLCGIRSSSLVVR